MCRSFAHTGGLFLIWPRGSGGGFSSTGSSAEVSWEGFGFENPSHFEISGGPF